MFNRTWLFTICSALLLGVTMVPAAGAFGTLPRKTTYLTFNQPVALPGVSLGSGTYIFELADPDGAWSVVRVLSRDRKQVYLSAFTHVVPRPEYVRENAFVSFAEAPARAAQPITVWWPPYESTGRQFIYPTRK